MRPIPATRLGDAHGLLRAIEKRGRLRTDEFVTEFNLDELFPPGLENALGRLRHFISFGRLAGLVKEDRGVVELTEIGKRYVRSEDPDAVFDVSPQQAEWLRRQLRERHMTDSIFHGLAIGLSLLASVPPGTRISTMDFGRSMAYLGRAGWDNENTLLIQGERHLTLLTDLELIDADHRLTATGEQLRGELTLPVHMSLADIAAQLNPGGAAAVRAAAEAEFAAPAPEPTPEVVEEEPTPEPAEVEEEPTAGDGYQTVISSAAGGAEARQSRPPIVPRAPDETPTPPSPERVQPAADPLLPFAGPPSVMPGVTPGDPLASPSTPPPPVAPAGSAPPPVVSPGAVVAGDVALGGEVPGGVVAGDLTPPAEPAASAPPPVEAPVSVPPP
ncbi:hypothetical protein OJ998_35730, partial [Solirubrobacter taibaiensis]|nr:hypothetical protein [Solirubrobacter taibaiensis]